jgi:site-specific DNA-methyltransferase (adenine-specific)
MDGWGMGAVQTGHTHGDTGGASRFFYTAKASRAERESGIDGGEKRFLATMSDGIGGREHSPDEAQAWTRNHHPTVKPIALMRWLVRLVTPAGGLVLDPFVGSGTTLVAAQQEYCRAIGVDQEAEYCEIAARRLSQGVLPLAL